MNLFDIPKSLGTEEKVTVLVQNSSVRIERIISSGQISGWYNQEQHEFVTLLAGRAVIEYNDGRMTELSAGDTLVIMPNEVHRVSYTSKDPPCVWLCVFYQETETQEK